MSDGRRPWWAFGCSDEMTERDRANMRRFNVYWMLAIASWVAVLLLLSREMVPPVGVVLVLVPAILIALSFWTMVHFLREADELTRSIQYRGMAVGFAAGLAATLMERLAMEVGELLGLTFDLHDLFMPLMWMALGYAIAVVRLQRSYSR